VIKNTTNIVTINLIAMYRPIVLKIVISRSSHG
jgi:hypothetical protein